MNAPNSPAFDLQAKPGEIRCYDPATRQRLGTVLIDDAAAVAAAVARAREAQIGWAQTDFALRRRVLRRVADSILAQMDALVDLVVRDSGKTKEHALMGEIWMVLEKLRWTIAHGPKHLRPERVSPGLMLHKKARIEYHPLGVIGAIVPWNYPLQNLYNVLVPALMAGNAYVVKPSEWVAWSARPFIQLVRDALVAEGQSPELVQVVQGFAPTGQALIDSGVDSLVFIGSVGNGQRVLEAAAKTITPVVLELGGKDPFIVCDDADLDVAACAAMVGCFVSAGQNCVAAERLLVSSAVYDDFERKVGALVGQLRQGDPRGPDTVDVGAMVTPMQLDIVEGLVRDAVQNGARVVAGGQRQLTEQGEFFAPTVLADVRPDMAIMREETFGPVMTLCRVQDDHEAVAVANATGFGLSSSVFSRDRDRARRIGERLQAGMTAINECGAMTYMAQDLTFGGVKHSGFGRINGREGLRACCNVKAVLDDRLPINFPNKVFPMGDRDFGRISGVVRLMYGRGIRGRLGGAAQLVRELWPKRSQGARR